MKPAPLADEAAFAAVKRLRLTLKWWPMSDRPESSYWQVTCAAAGAAPECTIDRDLNRAIALWVDLYAGAA